MKKNAKKLAIGAILATILIAMVIFREPSLTGFLILPQKSETSNQEEKALGTIATRLSLEIIQPTELKITPVKTEILRCPHYSSLVFELENTGNSTAEIIAVEPSGSLKILDCMNCSTKMLAQKEKITIKIKACKTIQKEEAFIVFRSINSEEKRIKI